MYRAFWFRVLALGVWGLGFFWFRVSDFGFIGLGLVGFRGFLV